MALFMGRALGRILCWLSLNKFGIYDPNWVSQSPVKLVDRYVERLLHRDADHLFPSYPIAEVGLFTPYKRLI